MKPGIFFLSALLFFACKVYSQSPSVLSACGGTSNINNISLEWTVGEPMVESFTTSTKLITQGFHQPLIITKNILPFHESTATLVTASVYPNPVQAVLTVKLSGGTTKASISLVNLQGHVLFSEQVNSKSNYTQINMENFPTAVYLLNVRDASGKVINTYKVIKVN